MQKEFKYEKDDTFDFTIDEKGNSFIALRRIKWGDSSEYKLDLRKYYSTADGERMSKGVTFATEEGPDELVKVLLEQNFGNIDEVVNAVCNRDDLYTEIFHRVINLTKDEQSDMISRYNVLKDKEEVDEEFYDPRDIM